MKQFRTLFIALALTIGATAFTNAQSKVAHIATQELVQDLPEYKSAMDQLQKLEKTYDAEIKDMLSEAQSTMQRYEAEANTKSEEENQKRATELQAAQRRIQEHSAKARQDLQKKETDLLKPILEKVRTAIQKVARAKGYDYVLDSTTGTGVLLADGYNLMPDVKKELGM
ncbi:periplasmic chaperone for outer membrane proteins Skp [Christiangramia gaetbulicola]|uniref:Periplasmic chaperone for outer membrane proteins Skp n=1 Tax=Christiangramia gaetbulicola TaxID=703340 RepID=A0A2T6AKS9_9FLAO|nr:OmpH family outer membrane protein [Christiangramia gaetbulicola]PTX44418.1 periplasmic chaperone for outer membrane proteins Skp [Christiangramia gaetbulicola]